MNSLLRILLLFAVFGIPKSPGFPTLSSANIAPANERQERTEKDVAQGSKRGSVPNIREATERLKRAVNGNSVVKNQCLIQGHTVQVEESTEISEADGCHLVVSMVKTSGLREGRQLLRFTMHADLADLSTPASVEPQSFSGCNPEKGVLLKVMSRVRPGKSIPTWRTSTSQPSTAPARKDLSFFFSDAIIARRAARALNRAVSVCGGAEWPDEDDLP